MVQRSVMRVAACLLGLMLGCGAFAQQRPAAPAAPPETREVDRVVAVVNDEPITLHELQARVQFISAQLRSQGTELPPQDVMQRQVLERLITDKVQMQLAKETGIHVDDATLDAALVRIADNNRLSPEQFRAALEKDGVSWDGFREDVRKEITLARLRDREVDSRITISDAEIDAFLAEQKGKTAEEVNIQHILLRIPEGASPEVLAEIRAKADTALSRIRLGEDFGKVAATLSQAPDALSGGVVGWRNLDRLPPLFVSALGTMKPGDVSDVLRSAAGFHILKLNDRRSVSGDGLQPVQQTHARHILIKTSPTMSDADARQRLLALKDRIDHGADFAELARINSADLSASKGGDLGWLYPGDTVPEFEHAMNALKPGEVSEPIHTQFGWHLIQVLARRTEDVSDERKRLMARQALRERRSDEAYQDWLRQLRDGAYVEYRLSEDQ